MTLTGYAVVFGGLTAQPFAPRGAFDYLGLRACFAPGAFDAWFKYEHNAKVLYQHRDEEVYARESDESLRLEIDDIGLRFTMEVEAVAHPRLREILPRIRGISAGFNTLSARTELVHGEQIWTIREAWLHEISLAENPRWPQTWVIAPALPALPLRYVSLGKSVAMLRRYLELEVAL